MKSFVAETDEEPDGGVHYSLHKSLRVDLFVWKSRSSLLKWKCFVRQICRTSGQLVDQLDYVWGVEMVMLVNGKQNQPLHQHSASRCRIFSLHHLKLVHETNLRQCADLCIICTCCWKQPLHIARGLTRYLHLGTVAKLAMPYISYALVICSFMHRDCSIIYACASGGSGLPNWPCHKYL